MHNSTAVKPLRFASCNPSKTPINYATNPNQQPKLNILKSNRSTSVIILKLAITTRLHSMSISYIRLQFNTSQLRGTPLNKKLHFRTIMYVIQIIHCLVIPLFSCNNMLSLIKRVIEIIRM